jgi:uncharacterized protein YidB (DUF937 family)
MAMLDGVISEVAGRFGLNGETARKLIGMLLQYVTGPGVGGLGGFLSKLKNLGLGSVFGAGGASTPLDGSKVESLLGDAEINNFASRLGVSKAAVVPAIGAALPALLNKLAPGGTAPATLPAEVNGLIQSAGGAARTAWDWLVWLLPLVAVALIALYLLKSCNAGGPPPTSGKAPEVVPTGTLPDAGKVTDEIKGLFGTATETLTGIKDAATAEAAAPKLQALLPQLDGVKELAGKLPAEGLAAVKKFAAEQLARLKPLIDGAVKLAGAAGEKIEPVLDKLVEKLSALAS